MNRKMHNNKVKKICHVQLLPIMSGVQRSMVEFLKKLDREAFEVYVICKEEGELTLALKELSIRYIIVPSLVRPINPILDLVSLIQFFRIFKQHKFDLVHTHSSKTGFLGRIAARLTGINRVFHTVHGLPFHDFMNPIQAFAYSVMERIGAKSCSKIIFVNHEERRIAERKRIVPPKKAVTIYNGVDHRYLEEQCDQAVIDNTRKELSLDISDFVIGYFGRFWKQKDPITLLKIIQACQELPVRFLLVGAGPYKKYFDHRLKNNDKVILTGWQSNPFRFYPLIDVLILPSLWEGLSMTLIEAMSFGKPLIASNISGNRECIQNGENGFLCPPKDVRAFKEAIEKIMGNNELYQQMSRRSKELSRVFFDADKNNEILKRFYENSYF